MWVSPFGYPRISARLQLPEAFRSLPRPSSAPGAKAFPLRSFSLDLLCESIRYSCSHNITGKFYFLITLFSPEVRLLFKRTPASPFALFIQFSRYSLFSLRFLHPLSLMDGGLKWTRTTDLALIRRAL